MSAKVLITGGAGFIGSHLAEALLEKGDEVFVLDNLSTGRKENIEHLEKNERFHFIKGDILDENLVADLVEKVYQVYHLAAAVGVRTILKEPLQSILTNISGTEIILREAEKNKTKVLITSSSEVYGKRQDRTSFLEKDDRTYGSVYDYRWLYAFSKGIDEYLALAYWKEKKLPVVVVRLFNVIGPRQTGTYGMVVPTFIRQAMAGEPIIVFGTGEQSRCFADVGDITPALISLMKEQEAIGKVFNIGSDDEISINELAKRIKNYTNSGSEIKHISYKQAYPEGGYEDLPHRKPDISKIKELTGYEPKIGLEKSIEKITEFQKQ